MLEPSFLDSNYLPTPETIRQLTQELLADQERVRALNLPVDETGVRSRLTRFQQVYPQVQQLSRSLGLPTHWPQLLWELWLPLAEQIVQWRQQQQQPLIQGCLGCQGSGKTTLATILMELLTQMGYPTVCLSLDDLYKTYADRRQLQQQDPRLDRRGPPGTHDIGLGLEVLDHLRQGPTSQPSALPRFDKSAHQGAGDRSSPELVSGIEIVLFEGWFVGLRPVEMAAIEQAPPPIVSAADRQFAQDMNRQLQDYLPLWQRLDRLIVLQPLDYRWSQQWRRQAEQRMKAQGKPGMEDGQVDRFVEYFWRALHPQVFLPPLLSQPGWADLVIDLGPDRQPQRVWKP